MSNHTVPTPAPDESDADRVADPTRARGRYCRCLSDRVRVWSRPLDAYVCPDCGGYRQ